MQKSQPFRGSVFQNSHFSTAC